MDQNIDRFMIENQCFLSEQQLSSLMFLYQPVIGNISISLFLTLYYEAGFSSSNMSIKHLLTLLKIDKSQFDQALNSLEEFNLITTYQKYDAGFNRYIYIINNPLSPNDFINDHVFSRLLLTNIGAESYELILLKYQKAPVDKDGYTNITKRLSIENVDNYTIEDEMVYSTITKTIDHTTSDITFDYDKFLKRAGMLLFPLSARTKENLDMIGHYATLYGISVDEMRFIVARCTNPDENIFNAKRFESYMRNYQPTINNDINPYLLPCLAFLQTKQNGGIVPINEKRLLDDLNTKMKLKPEVINVIIEYVLKNNDNRLTKNYVDSIASSIKRANIETYQDALNYLENIQKNTKSYKKPSKKVYKKPDIVENNIEDNDLTAEELKQLSDWLKDN